MKQRLLIICLLLIGNTFSQQTPNWVWHAMNWGGINPSHHGLNQYVEASMGFKRQWMGFQGAPTTLNATISFPFNDRKSDAAMFGMGINTLVEKTGPFSFASASLEGAVNLLINKENRLSMGLGIGFIQIGYDPAYVTTNEQDIIVSRFSSNSYPQIKVGMTYRAKNSLTGFYVNDLAPVTWNNIGLNSSLRPEWGVYFRYFVKLHEDIYFLPTLKVSEVFYTPINYEIMLKLNYNYRLQVYLGTQNLNSLHLGLGIRFKEIFIVNYLFENGRVNLKGLSLNSHSLGLKCILNNRGAILKKQQLLLD